MTTREQPSLRPSGAPSSRPPVAQQRDWGTAVSDAANPSPPVTERRILRRRLGTLAESLSKLASRPVVRLWGGMVARVLGISAVLVGIAWYGQESRERELYGDLLVVRADEHLGPGPEPSPVEARNATQVQVAQPGRSLAPGHAHPEQEMSSKGEAAPVAQAPCATQAEVAPRAKAFTADGKVILNEATQDELMTLKGVGEKRAADILALRERLGRFRKVSDLLRVRGIGWKSLQRLKEKVVLDRPDPVPETAEEVVGPVKPASAS